MLLGVCDLGLGGSTEPPEPPLDPPQEALALGSGMNSTRLDSNSFKAFFRKTSQSTLCLLRFSAGQDMLTQEETAVLLKKLKSTAPEVLFAV